MPRALSVLTFLALFAVLCGLGFWQLSRAEQKHLRFVRFTERLEARPTDFDLLDPSASAESLRWRRIEVSGRYHAATILLDNRTRSAAVGYEVLTPFETRAGRLLLVDRGWVPLGASRDTLPRLERPAGEVVLRGFLGPPPVVGLDLGGDGAGLERLGESVWRVQRPELDGIAQVLGGELAPVVLFLDTGSPGAFDAEWPVPGDGAARHRAYATQWFAMAAVLALIGVAQLRRGRADG